MLLPSAISCDSSSSNSLPKPYYPSSTLFASPPISPTASSHSQSNPTISSIYSTCRALQSMLSPVPTQLPSPPTQHMNTPLIASPFKLRLRNRGVAPSDSNLTPRKRITKRVATVPRGVNKRRRALDDDMSREDNMDTEPEMSETDEEKENTIQIQRERSEEEEGPRTPKRLRLAPEILPLGLERNDFHALHLQHQLSSQPLYFPSPSSSSTSTNQQNHTLFAPDRQPGTQGEDENEEWTTEDDRLLVELVLEKLKLSKSEWQDCARSLGRDRGSVGKRWKSLMAGGDVGLKGRLRGANVTGANASGRRRGIYGSWR